MTDQDYRKEEDTMGVMRVTAHAYFGAQTARALENFPISGLKFPEEFIEALGLIKLAAAKVNREKGLLDAKVAETIIKAAQEVADGDLIEHFPLDVFQTGSGTSTNMNANEVIANRANEMLGKPIGSKSPVHPNDHVNMSQSSNDVIPTAMHVAAASMIEKKLLPALEQLRKALADKAEKFDGIVKIGRTHLQDAVPIRLGQEFRGYASMVAHGILKIISMRSHLAELPIGGTAVGTGLNAFPGFGGRMAEELGSLTGVPFKEAPDHMEAQGARDAVVGMSGALKALAVSLMKIANDIRWLGSGPLCGIGELKLPAVQPGSSIMPGKANPVIAEAVCQVCVKVMGNDVSITLAGQSGNFELNVMMTVMAYDFLQSIGLLANVSRIFAEKCIEGIEADEARCRENIEKSLALVTALVPEIGYDKAAALAKEAHEGGKTIRELLLEKKVLPEKKIKRILDARKMTGP